MSTDKADEQETPGRQIAETEEDDTEGHKQIFKNGDPAEAPSRQIFATSDDDDTEGHVKIV